MSAPDLVDRLRARRDDALAGVLGAASPRWEPPHRELTVELVDAVLERLLGSAKGPARDALRALGGRYAEAGVSHAHARYELHRTIIELSRRWWQGVRPADVTALLQLGQAVDDDVEPMRAALSDGFCAAMAASGTRSLSRRQLVENLLAGLPVAAALCQAADAGGAEQYLVLCSAYPEPPVPVGDVAERFGIRGVLAHREDDRLVVLVPVGARGLGPPAQVAARGFARLAALTGATVAGACVAPRGELPRAGAEARATLAAAVAGRRHGAVRAEQVLVERALVGSATALRELADLITGLGRWPHLPETLRVLYAHDLDRSATAEDLHIARRTLSKRLDRIQQLTGLHPASARGVQTFLSALAADRLLDGSAARTGVS